ncbi:prevent-host-death protein [Massilia sp. R2A-15]|uniref:prevent-host-death protein n=1 Tax=Massilia sp. R2A-15 TaxID=3064278 RepID=UPI0027375723|nr:prevent-host-death protein [Massilia sp. R2A-15]WLI89098.1 prevent-host-death protein [Massilia sp. R2A-15]
MDRIFAPRSVDISELKADPAAVLESAGDDLIAVLDAQKAIGYLLSPKAWERICALLEDAELLEIVETRLSDGKTPIRINLDDL